MLSLVEVGSAIPGSDRLVYKYVMRCNMLIMIIIYLTTYSSIILHTTTLTVIIPPKTIIATTVINIRSQINDNILHYGPIDNTIYLFEFWYRM